MKPGLFISFEGGEGSGKSTHAKALFDKLHDLGRDVVLTFEPGGSPGANAIRELVLNEKTYEFSPLTQTLLFSAARADHLEKTIRPALAAGKWVISDRFCDSTRAYQGHADKVGKSDIEVLERLVVGDTMPSLTFLLDVPAEKGLERAASRAASNNQTSDEKDRFESRELAFHESLREAFLQMAKEEPDRIVVIDALQEQDQVFAQIWTAVSDRLLQT